MSAKVYIYRYSGWPDMMQMAMYRREGTREGQNMIFLGAISVAAIPLEWKSAEKFQKREKPVWQVVQCWGTSSGCHYCQKLSGTLGDVWT